MPGDQWARAPEDRQGKVSADTRSMITAYGDEAPISKRDVDGGGTLFTKPIDFSSDQEKDMLNFS